MDKQLLWEAVKIVAGNDWEYEAVPFAEVMGRLRYTHLRSALELAAAKLDASRPEAGEFICPKCGVRHICPPTDAETPF